MKRVLSWKFMGEILQWVGIVYAVGFAVLGLASVLVIVPKYQSVYSSIGQGAVFGFGEQAIGPLILFFLLLSGATWFEGREIASSADLNWYDKVVSVVLLAVMLILVTPQLYQGFISIIPAIRG